MSAAITVIAALAAVTSLAFAAIAGWRRAGEQKARADVLEVNLTERAERLAEATKDLKDTKERLDDVAEMAIQYAAAQPVDGAFARMLARLGIARKTASGDGDAAVLHERTAARNEADRLYDPRSE